VHYLIFRNNPSFNEYESMLLGTIIIVGLNSISEVALKKNVSDNFMFAPISKETVR
jgi:hypothetical protein